MGTSVVAPVEGRVLNFRTFEPDHRGTDPDPCDNRWVLALDTCAPPTSGKVKIVMEGKRDLLQMPDLAVLALPVTVQLGNRGNDTC